MIQITNVSKSFGEVKAVDNVSLEIGDGQVFGLIGTNGAGKSTLLRMVAGILKCDSGCILIDGQPVYENPGIKRQFFFIPDEACFWANATPSELATFYAGMYETFDRARFDRLMESFSLEHKRKVSTFSKGMKKQLSVILGLSAGTRYLFCDETFDGLDPVMRQGVKSLFAGDMAERDFTPVIASHNLRELEDICDNVGLLHRGGILLSRNLDDIKADVHKLQCVFSDKETERTVRDRLRVLTEDHRGSLMTLVVRGEKSEILDTVREGSPIFMELLPLSLEEIFISETGVEGYDIQKVLA
ncbi:MAG: ABC transporter ATP-binding protein [Butyrivibrio sp.]|nr:ABC transporter ATP-binding protein [Butyrivibrio sp.]